MDQEIRTYLINRDHRRLFSALRRSDAHNVTQELNLTINYDAVNNLYRLKCFNCGARTQLSARDFYSGKEWRKQHAETSFLFEDRIYIFMTCRQKFKDY